jgi:hypothetical protein
MTVHTEKVRIGTLQQFKDYTLSVARGERMVDPDEPKIWIEHRNARDGGPCGTPDGYHAEGSI